jgi:S1-C subfamily serine protease
VFLSLSIGQTAGFVVGHRFGRLARRGGLGGLDSGTGIAFSVGVALLAFWLVGSVLVQGPSREIARAFKDSRILVALNQALPEPPDVLSRLRHYLETSGFPQVFAGVPREVGPPVDLPTQREARSAARAASASTVRIVVPACGGTQVGSGWVAADDAVVTNAHVVAGGEQITVQDTRGDHTGRVVLFDGDIDVAVVRVGGLAGPPLPLSTESLSRGAPGATLGYPGHRGGELIVHRAAVQARFEAVGRNIYGRGQVRRNVYELRAPVRRGDSGGPFVLPNGQVAGVVFAASTTEGQTGYALTGSQVESHVQRGAARTEPVSTGPCTR